MYTNTRHRFQHYFADTSAWRQHAKTVAQCLAATILLLCVLHYWKPYLFSYAVNYIYLILDSVKADQQRYLERQVEAAQIEWRLLQMQLRFMPEWCKENQPSRQDLTWLSVTVNEEFVIPMIVVGHLVKKLSCQQNLLAFVSGDEVSEAGIQTLQKVGYRVDKVESLDCNWLERQMGLPETNTGIKGTHTRFHAWNYTQYSKMVYLDADYLPLLNVDELFDLDTDFGACYCGPPGVVDPCFNAGLLVFRPSKKIMTEIMDLWKELSFDSCTNDQRVLWHYFADQGRWLPLAYSYNVRRYIYRPMKAFHFAGKVHKKPWKDPVRPTKGEAKNFKGPLLSYDDVRLFWWKMFYEAVEEHNLQEYWESSKFYNIKSKHN